MGKPVAYRKPSAAQRAMWRASGSVAETLEQRTLLSALLQVNVHRISGLPLSGQTTDAHGQPLMTIPLDVFGPSSTAGPVGLTPAQIRHAYGIDATTFNGGAVIGDGTGQTIAIVDAFDNPGVVSSTSANYATSDLHMFDQQFGLVDPPSFTKVGYGGVTPVADSGWGLEIDLDIEWAHVVAPKASIVLVEAQTNSTTDLVNAVDYAASLPSVGAISLSWGGSDSAGNNFDAHLLTPAGHQGITFLASTGDSGSPGGYPAASPNVLAVGGTTLTLSGGNYSSETGWSGSGGGVTIRAKPSYQSGVTLSATNRTIPDIAFDADPASGVAVYDVQYSGSSTPWSQIGGTSLSSPCWAGLIAIANQGMALAGSGTLNGLTQTLPLLYHLPASDFHDILSGSNGLSAGPGYDLVTGIGSPIVNQLIPDLVNAANPLGHVISSNPGSGSSIFGAAPTDIVLTVSAPIDPATVQAGALTVNGISADSASMDVTGRILTFHFNSTPITAQGSQTIALNHTLKRTSDETLIDPYNATFYYALTQLQVASTSIPPGTQASLPLTSLTVNFNEAFNPATVSAANLVLSSGTVSGASVQAGNTSVVYSISGITTEQNITATIAAGAITDVYGAAVAGFSSTFATDIVSAAMPASMSVAPLGSQIYQSTATGLVGIPSDTDRFTIALDSGQTLSVVLHPTSGTLRPSISVLDPSNVQLGAATAAAANQDAVVQSLPLTAAGTYTIVVGSDGTTAGQYSIQATLNAAVETEEHSGPSDDTIATAQILDSAFKAATGNASIASAIGKLGASATDYYGVTLLPGQTLSASLAVLAGAGSPTLELYNGSGILLSSWTTGQSNVAVAIPNYIASSAGTYYLKLTGSSIDYSLVVAKNATFDLEPNNSLATAQNTFNNSVVVGGVSAAGAIVDLENFESGTLSPYTFTGSKSVVISAAAAHDGASGMLSPANSTTEWMYRNDSAAQNQRGQTVSVWMRDTSASPAGRAYFGFGATSSGALSLVMAPNSNAFIIQRNAGYGFANLAGVNQTWAVNKWYRVEANWKADGTIVANLYDSDGITLLNTVTAVDTTISSGGIAFRAFTDGFDFDTVRLTGAAGDSDYYSLPLTAGNPIVFSTLTPAGGAGEFVNSLDPALELYDPSGVKVASDDNSSPDGHNAVLSYTPSVTGTYKIRVLPSSLSGTGGEYLLSMGSSLKISAPSDMREGDAPAGATLTMLSAPLSDVTISLTSADPGRLSVPASVVLPAGQTSVSFPVDVVDNSLLDGLEVVSIFATGAGYAATTAAVNVHDNETAVLGISLAASAKEGDAPLAGVITASAAPTRDITVQLASSNPLRLSAPASVILKAGQTTASFSATVVDNTIIDGTASVSVSAGVENWTTGNATVAVADNDNTITLNLPSGFEGQTVRGSVVLGGTLSTDWTINLSSSDTTAVIVPDSVVVKAGQRVATFNLTLVDDGATIANRTAQISASGSGLVGTSANMFVNDQALGQLTIQSIVSPQKVGYAIKVQILAFNNFGAIISSYNGTATVTALGQNGAKVIGSTSSNFVNGVSFAYITVTAADPAAFLSVSSGGLAATGNTFAVQSVPVVTLGWDPFVNPATLNVPFTAPLSALDDFGNVVIDYNGPVNFSASGTTYVPQTIVGNTSYGKGSISGSITFGYQFTPSSNVQVTALRAYFGTKVSLWTNAGTLLASQVLNGVAGTWTDYLLNTPLTLTAGATYIIGVYVTGSGVPWYVNKTAPSNPSFAALGRSLQSNGDAFPTGYDPIFGFVPVDVRVGVPTATAIPLTPSSANFINGIWSGALSAGLVATAVTLHADDGAGHVGDTPAFNIVAPTVNLVLPADVREGDGVVSGSLSIIPTTQTNLIVNLSSSNPSRLSVPTTVFLPAGQTSISFPITVIDDSLLNGLGSIGIFADIANYHSIGGSINVHDNETANLSVTLPAAAHEGDTNIAGMITSSAAPTQDIVVQLASDLTSRLTVPATVVLRAGQTTANFSVNTVENTAIDGSQTANVTASVENWISGSAPVAVQDNDGFITVAGPVGGGWEGQAPTGTVTLGGTVSTPTVVNLSSDNAGLTVPASVTVLAGQNSANFTLTFPTDALKNGSRLATVTATSSGLTAGSAGVTIHDSNLDHLGIDPIAGPKTAGTAFNAKVRAYNISNEMIAIYAGAVVLGASRPAGSLTTNPTSVTLVSGVWSGNVTVTTADSAVSLTAGSGALSASSNPFVVQAGALSTFAWIAASGPKIVGAPFAETLTAQDAYGNTQANFQGTVNLSGVGTGTTSATLMSNSAYDGSHTGSYTIGYAFTPNVTVQVTAVRSFWGQKVSIWNDSGVLLASQAVAGTNGVWTETPLASPITLQAGVRYRVAARTVNTPYYYRKVTPTFSWGVINGSYYSGADAFPTATATDGIHLVDLRVNIAASVPVAVTPTTATFINGVWSGNMTVTQTATALRLHADDLAGHTADSGPFDVLTLSPSPQTLSLLAVSDSGALSNDGLTKFNNASPATVLQFQVGGTTIGATVSLYIDGSLAASAVASGATTLLTTDGATKLSDGVHQVTARQTASGQAQSADSPAVAVTIDTAAPVVTANALTTTDTTPPLSGTVDDPAAAVQVTVNGVTYEAINNGDGTWTLADNVIGPALASGPYTIAVTATDRAGNAANAAAQLNIGTAPSLQSWMINDGGVQRAMINSLTLTFTKPVALGAGALSLSQRSTNGGAASAMPFAVSTPDGGVTYILSFTDSTYTGNSLPDGTYDLTIHGAQVSDGTSIPMPGDQTVSFYRLYADYNGDGSVDFKDFIILSNHFGYSLGDQHYLWYIDYLNAGVVDFADFIQLSNRFGVSASFSST